MTAHAKRRARRALRETDLDAPVRTWLERLGFTVRGEVHGCDLAAVRGDDLVVVELKRGFTVDLLMQAVDRQRVSDQVYVAVPRLREMAQPKKWRGMLRLLRRLELGLLVVSLGRGRAAHVEVALDPAPYDATKRRKHAPTRRALLSEIAGRSREGNRGGSRGRRLLTAYRESALRIACALEANGPLTPKRLRALGTGEKTTSILSDDHYGWFARVERGVYALRDGAGAQLDEWSMVVDGWRRHFALAADAAPAARDAASAAPSPPREAAPPASARSHR